MHGELIFTSIQRGLLPNTTGYCIAAATEKMGMAAMLLLKKLSVYHHLYALSDPRYSNNPVNLSFTPAELSGQPICVFSRIASVAADYSGRSNYIAHHFITDAMQSDSSPAQYLLALQHQFRDSYTDQAQRLAPCLMPPISSPDSSLPTWNQLGFDPGLAGILARKTLDEKKPCFFVYEPQQAEFVLPMMTEALALLPPEHRWTTSFATWYSGSARGRRWRGLIKGTPTAEKELQRDARALVLDLTATQATSASGPDAEAARRGEIIYPTPQPTEEESTRKEPSPKLQASPLTRDTERPAFRRSIFASSDVRDALHPSVTINGASASQSALPDQRTLMVETRPKSNLFLWITAAAVAVIAIALFVLWRLPESTVVIPEKPVATTQKSRPVPVAATSRPASVAVPKAFVLNQKDREALNRRRKRILKDLSNPKIAGALEDAQNIRRDLQDPAWAGQLTSRQSQDQYAEKLCDCEKKIKKVQMAIGAQQELVRLEAESKKLHEEFKKAIKELKNLPMFSENDSEYKKWSRERAKAEDLFRDKKWSEAAPKYKSLVQSIRLGGSLYRKFAKHPPNVLVLVSDDKDKSALEKYRSWKREIEKIAWTRVSEEQCKKDKVLAGRSGLKELPVFSNEKNLWGDKAVASMYSASIPDDPKKPDDNVTDTSVLLWYPGPKDSNFNHQRFERYDTKTKNKREVLNKGEVLRFLRDSHTVYSVLFRHEKTVYAVIQKGKSYSQLEYQLPMLIYPEKERRYLLYFKTPKQTAGLALRPEPKPKEKLQGSIELHNTPSEVTLSFGRSKPIKSNIPKKGITTNIHNCRFEVQFDSRKAGLIFTATWEKGRSLVDEYKKACDTIRSGKTKPKPWLKAIEDVILIQTVPPIRLLAETVDGVELVDCPVTLPMQVNKRIPMTTLPPLAWNLSKKAFIAECDLPRTFPKTVGSPGVRAFFPKSFSRMEDIKGKDVEKRKKKFREKLNETTLPPKVDKKQVAYIDPLGAVRAEIDSKKYVLRVSLYPQKKLQKKLLSHKNVKITANSKFEEVLSALTELLPSLEGRRRDFEKGLENAIRAHQIPNINYRAAAARHGALKSYKDAKDKKGKYKEMKGGDLKKAIKELEAKIKEFKLNISGAGKLEGEIKKAETKMKKLKPKFQITKTKVDTAKKNRDGVVREIDEIKSIKHSKAALGGVRIYLRYIGQDSIEFKWPPQQKN